MRCEQIAALSKRVAVSVDINKSEDATSVTTNFAQELLDEANRITNGYQLFGSIRAAAPALLTNTLDVATLRIVEALQRAPLLMKKIWSAFGSVLITRVGNAQSIATC